MSSGILSRRNFIKGLCAAPLLLSGCGSHLLNTAGAGKRPNVILVITDDQGYGDLGVTGNNLIRTPNIDAMARRSGSMKNFYVSPVCAPTRACLMTGRYNYRTRVVDTYVGRAMMEPEETTVAEILRDSGYETGIFGKWHLGDNYPMRPMDQGFTESLVIRSGGIGQPSDPPGGEGKYTDPILADNGKLKQFKGYCTDIYFDRAMSWISECTARSKSFFAYIPTNAPHSPFHDVPQQLYEQYKAMDLSNRNFPQDKGHKLPDDNNPDNRARIYAMITNIDDNIGRLFARLDRLGITNNTIVIFMVDNGPNGRRYVAGFKGMKSYVYEGGIHSPFFFHWPAVVKPGTSSDRIAAHIDILPTILESCGLPRPDGLKLDGRSILPLLQGKKIAWHDRTIYIQTHRGDTPVLYHHFAARNQRWKLLHASGFGRESFEGRPKFELYDMTADPLEQNDLAVQRPEIVSAMRRQYEQWFADVGSTRADNYTPPKIYIGTAHENPVVLTRQDWRHLKGRPWAADSNGYWQLYADKTGKYDINIDFPAVKTSGELMLEISGQKISRTVNEGQTSVKFEDISIAKGPARLMATLALGDTTKGPWHVNITW
ncbi:MAG: arylsulfatase [Sedimentisphaerales bacterium]|nr:arylsulfatase [Sedimentisphaerales bacterium]